MRFRYTHEAARRIRVTNPDGEPVWLDLVKDQVFYDVRDWSSLSGFLSVDSKSSWCGILKTRPRTIWPSIRALNFKAAKELTGLSATSWADLQEQWEAR